MRFTGEGEAVGDCWVSVTGVLFCIGLEVTVPPGDCVVSPVEQEPIKNEGINRINAMKRKYFGCFNIILWIDGCG